jgi:membrane associated rhomboid family serine protease
MGSRSNIRNYQVRFDFFITPGVQALLVATFSVFFFQVILNQYWGSAAHDSLIKWFGLVPAAVIPLLRIWQLVTYLFLHDVRTVWHILMNMFYLWMFGRELELVWGKKRFLQYYFLTGAGAGLINVLVKTVPVLWGHSFSLQATIGASGAIYGILIGNAILFPDRQVSLFLLPIRMRMRTVVLVMVAIEFFSTLGSSGDGVSHICHLGGGLIGWLYLRRDSFLFRVRNGYTDWKVQRTRKRFQVYLNRHKNEPPSRPDRWVN